MKHMLVRAAVSKLLSNSWPEICDRASEIFRPLTALLRPLHSPLETVTAGRLVPLGTKQYNAKKLPRKVTVTVAVRNLRAARNMLPASRRNTRTFSKEEVDRNLKVIFFSSKSEWFGTNVLARKRSSENCMTTKIFQCLSRRHRQCLQRKNIDSHEILHSYRSSAKTGAAN